MDLVSVGDVQLSYRQVGEGPDVVLVHGVAGNMAGWYLCGLVSELSKQFRVTTYDLRGHGFSGASDDGYTSRDMAEDLHQLLTPLEIRNPVILGHSFGATIGLHLAAEYPRAVRSVILSDVFLPGLADILGCPSNWPGWSSYKSFAAKLGLDLGDEWTDLDQLFDQIAAMTEAEKDVLAAGMGQQAVDRLVAISSTTCGKDVAQIAGLTPERIADITHPIVCLNGASSPFRDLAYHLEERLENCRVTLVPDAEHFAFEENPADFVGLAAKEVATLHGVDSASGTSVSTGQLKRTRTMMTRP